MRKILLLSVITAWSLLVRANNLPNDFVYLKDIDPTIQQDIRYATYHNFIGKPINGYEAGQCILTRQAAEALKQVQADLRKSNLSLKVYDCYRPQRAVDEFIAWSQQPQQDQMKGEFYPRVDKKDVFALGYVAAKSGHSRGSTMDLTIVPISAPKEEIYQRNQALVACTAPEGQRFRDNSINMGTGFDCLDQAAHIDYRNIPAQAYQNRMLLQRVMKKYGFVPYPQEWWHFTLKNEPFPNTYFNFPILAEEESSSAIR